MSVEPLSDTTRNAKRNLLVAGILAVSYRGFDVTVEKLSVAGIGLEFNKGLFTFLLVMFLAYLLVSFCTYYFIDLRNLEEPPHLANSRDRYSQSGQDRIDRYLHIAHNRANRAVDGTELTVNFTSNMGIELRRILNANKEDRESILVEIDPHHLYQLQMRNSLSSLVQRPAHAEEFKKVDAVALNLLREFPTFRRGSAFAARSRLESINSVYRFRNYFLDFTLPVGLGIVGILAMYQRIPLQWLRHIAPSQ